MIAYKECKFYIKGGKCSLADAPNPNHSYCIGRNACGAWEDDTSWQVKPQQPKAETK